MLADELHCKRVYNLKQNGTETYKKRLAGWLAELRGRRLPEILNKPTKQTKQQIAEGTKKTSLIKLNPPHLIRKIPIVPS